MKIAISGKGGAGKSTIAAALSLLMARRGWNVLAVDADPVASLASFLGIPGEKRAAIIPISQHRKLVEERTGAKVRQYGQIFKLNPDVSDIAGTCAIAHDGVSLLVLGAVQRGGGGCACPENILVKALVTDLVLHNRDTVIMDMEAGIEHLGRGTAAGVDRLIVVTDPGLRSIECGLQIVRLASDIGIGSIGVVANRVGSAADEARIRDAFTGHPFLGALPVCEPIGRADRDGVSVLSYLDAGALGRFESIIDQLTRSAP